jgi:hypothetical protein
MKGNYATALNVEMINLFARYRLGFAALVCSVRHPLSPEEAQTYLNMLSTQYAARNL